VPSPCVRRGGGARLGRKGKKNDEEPTGRGEGEGEEIQGVPHSVAKKRNGRVGPKKVCHGYVSSRGRKKREKKRGNWASYFDGSTRKGGETSLALAKRRQVTARVRAAKEKKEKSNLDLSPSEKKNTPS